METNITRRKLSAMAHEEAKAAREYRKLGFHTLAHDEERHARLLIGYARLVK